MSEIIETEVTSVVAAEVIPVAPPVGGPEIVYLTEAAKAVSFSINPNALRYVVNENGVVSEDMA